MAERKVHVDDESCWCEPFMYYRSAVTAREVWVHRTARRISSAGFHMGLMKDPPPEVLSEAVRLADGDADETLADILGALRA
ncbi:MAG: hypothetical protein IT454_19140, partial [Planctomycetes bacterium]|nr:hypothetical protein [Planctomycetota bacterium]